MKKSCSSFSSSLSQGEREEGSREGRREQQGGREQAGGSRGSRREGVGVGRKGAGVRGITFY